MLFLGDSPNFRLEGNMDFCKEKINMPFLEIDPLHWII